jgi:hypothetical protein
MSTAFEIPEWLLPAPPPPAPPADDHRIEEMVNHFIAGKQEALFTAPDAFYRLEGVDAIDGQPAINDRLQALRAATLDLARDDSERAALGPRLDLHIDDAADGIDRHVAAQRRVYQRQVVAQRQALIQRAAELEHDNDAKILGLAEANATAAREGARMDGIAPDSPQEAAAILGARSDILRRAIDERIANRKGAQALALFDQVKDQLSPADRLSLDTPVQATRLDQAADQWIARETGTDGPPLQERLAADPDLPSDAKSIVRAKLDARESADESARVAKVQALDDEAREALRILPTKPGAYPRGTFARLSDAYDIAGEPQKAAEMRQLALQEPFLRAFAQSSPDRQQKLIDSLAPQDRSAAEAIQGDQSEAPARDASIGATALGDEIASPSRIEALDDDIETGRLLDAIYGGGQPDLAAKSADEETASGLLLQVQDVRDNDRQGKAGEDAEVARIKRIDPRARIVRQIRVYVDGGPSYMVADILFKGNGTSVVIVEVKTGSGVLTGNQVKALAEAARTGGVYISNVEAADMLGVKPGVTFGKQRILPDIYVIGGNSPKIEGQMRNQGLEVRPTGVRGRLRIGGPPM